MKQITTYILTILLFTACKKNVDIPTPTNMKHNYFTFKGEIGTNDNSTIISNDSNLIICGNNRNNISVLKITKNGTQIWRNDLKEGRVNTTSGVAEISGNIFIGNRTTRNYKHSKSDVLLIKLDAFGDTIWTKNYGGARDEYFVNIISTSDGNLLISSKTESFGAGTFGDFYLIKVNTAGDTLWTTHYPDQGQELPYHLMETQNGEYLITGSNDEDLIKGQLYLLKVSGTGKQLWNKKIGSNNVKCGYSTIELANGDLMICGKQNINKYDQILVVKTDKFGNVIWEKEYGTNNVSQQGNSIKQNLDGTFTILGFSYLKGEKDMLLLKIDQNGNQLWLKKFDMSIWGQGKNLIKNKNDDNIITGNYISGQIFMTKIDNNGVLK